MFGRLQLKNIREKTTLDELLQKFPYQYAVHIYTNVNTYSQKENDIHDFLC